MDEGSTRDEGLSDTRLYGSAIAIISGLYSVYLSMAGSGMSANAWVMLAIGLVVLVHGVALLTPLAEGFTASGPLMIVYAVVMLADQAWLATRDPPGMMDTMTGMTWDAGMVAIAVLMLASGAIMTARS